MEFWYDPETIDLSLTDLVPGVDFLNPQGDETLQAAAAAAAAAPPDVGPPPAALLPGAASVTKTRPDDGPDEKPGADRASDAARRRCRRPASRLPRTAVRVLEEWLAEHRETPYPSHQRLDELQAETGLERSQVLNWFANARKRGKARPRQSTSSNASPSQPNMSSLLTHTSHLHPLEKWFYSSIDSEAVTVNEIEEAIKMGQIDSIPQHGYPRWQSKTRQFHDISNDWHCLYDESSASSMEIRSYAANIRSVTSDQWKPAPPSNTTKSIRRRHRRTASLACVRARGGEVSDSPGEQLRRFQCTFCNESFKRKHDWQRHEKSQHLPLEKWICCPDGSVNVDTKTNEVTCVFCGAADPDPEHVHAHGYTQCISRPLPERTFYRKDHLRQHLRLMHGGCGMAPCMDGWKSGVTALRSRCGFCGSEHETWQARIDHIAEHFRDGATMKAWKGDWGFEPEISGILERATLPEERIVQDTENRDAGTGLTEDGAAEVPPTEYVSPSHSSFQHTDSTTTAIYPLTITRSKVTIPCHSCRQSSRSSARGTSLSLKQGWSHGPTMPTSSTTLSRLTERSIHYCAPNTNQHVMLSNFSACSKFVSREGQL